MLKLFRNISLLLLLAVSLPVWGSYYHSDHLGSAAWITDGQGLPVQYIMYAPYGEELLNQHPFSYSERFTFTGKERDAETGYDYFGARYRESNFLNHFISVDPLADKFIDKTPYLYCDGNPIKYIDSDGREKHNYLNRQTDPNLYKGCENYNDNKPTIHIWAHGNNHVMHFYDDKTNKTIVANDANKVLDFLKEYIFKNSEAWKKHESDGTQAVIVLHSCETGKGENSIAQQLSALLPNTIIIAPTEMVAVGVDNQIEIGSCKTKQETDSSGKTRLVVVGTGAWVMFRNGEKIGSFNGQSKPNVSNPATFHVEL